MLLDGRASGTNLSGKVHLLEEVMVFSLSPPPAKYRTNPYTPFQFSFSKQTNSSSTSSSLSELMTSLDSQSFFAAISS